MGMQPAYCESSPYDVCKSSFGRSACPKTCDCCPIQPKFTKTIISKVDCPEGKSQYGNDKVICWKAEWNNGNGESTIKFNPNYVEIEGRWVTVGYRGKIEFDPYGLVFADGDVENGLGPVTVSWSQHQNPRKILN